MKIIIVNKYLYRIAIPLIIIVGLILTGIYILSEGSDSMIAPMARVLYGLIMTAGLWLGCLTIVNWLWRKYPWQESPRKHLLYEIFIILFYTIIYASLIYSIASKFIDLKTDKFPVSDIFMTIIITFFITALHEAYFFYVQWKLHFSKSVKLEKENIEANFEALKNQINPHFLFNSLNSLTSMVDDRPEAVSYISDLSDFLRYLLNSNEKELVSLREELDVAQKYVKLQQSRFGDALQFEISVEESKKDLFIPPLCLQMLVENAIKHNIISKDKKLKISIYERDDSLYVKNNLNKKTSAYSTGKGLKNIRKRFELFSGKSIKVKESETDFLVKIPLLSLEK